MQRITNEERRKQQELLFKMINVFNWRLFLFIDKTNYVTFLKTHYFYRVHAYRKSVFFVNLVEFGRIKKLHEPDLALKYTITYPKKHNILLLSPCN